MNIPPRYAESAAVLLIVLLAAALRLLWLDIAPPGLFRDEAEKGYTALQLWETGRHGIPGAADPLVSAPMPLFIETFAGHDQTSAIYHYLAAPIVGVFGLDVWTTRLPAALAGILAVGLLYGFFRREIGPGAALLAAAILAAQPTAIIFSRWAQQGAITPPLLIGGLWLLAEIPRARPDLRRAIAVTSALLFALAAYSYAPARMTIPLIAAAWIASRSWEVLRARHQEYLWFAGIFLVVYAPVFFYTLNRGSSRLGRVGLLPEGIAGWPSAYLSHFSADFWFVSGDFNARHRLGELSFSGWGGALLTIAGLVALAVHIRQRNEPMIRLGAFLAAALMIAPLAASLTDGTPHALRGNLLPLASALLAGYTVTMITPGRAGIASVLIASAFVFDAGRALREVYTLHNAPGGPWADGVVESLDFALEQPGPVYLSGEIPYAIYFVLFAERTDPARFQKEGLEATRVQILPPGQTPALPPGAVYIGPPRGDLPEDYFQETVVIYARSGEELSIRKPPE